MPWRWKRTWRHHSGFLVWRKYGDEYYIGKNDALILGGPNSGKTLELEKLRQRLEQEGKRVCFIPGTRPVTDWYRLNNIEGKNNFEREESLVSEKWDWVLLDDADKLARSKQEILKRLLCKGKNGPVLVATASNFRNLPVFLQDRLDSAREIRLNGVGGGVIDLTYTVAALIMLAVSVVSGGAHAFFMALIAMRWLTREA